MADKTPKMESVKEESGDESNQRSQSGSKMDKASSHLTESVPSEDQPALHSHRSVDWRVQVPEAKEPTESQYSEEQFEQPSESVQESINERLSERESEAVSEDLQSNPEHISASNVSELDLKADRIAQELMELLIEDYKADEGYTVTTEPMQIDEESFKDKWPYTLDVKPEPEPISAPNSARSAASAPAKKPKTQKEKDDDAYLEKHSKQMAEVDSHNKRVTNFLDHMV